MLQYNPTVTGSLQVSGDITGTINGINITGLSQSLSTQLVTVQSSTASSDAKFETLSGVTSSALTRLTNIESKSASVDISITNINSFTASNANTSLNTYTGSNDTKFTTLATYTGSLDTKNTILAAVTSSLISKTGSYATTGSNTFFGTQTFSGSVYIANDLVVQGSSSIQYISASSVSIGTNIVQLNTATPSVRYAGLSVQDSGSSAGVTGSMLWDSLCNRWIYSNPSGVGYSGGMLLSGPRTQTLGTEPTLTCNYIAKSGGGDHLYDSCIIDDGTTTCIKNNLITTGTVSLNCNLTYSVSAGTNWFINTGQNGPIIRLKPNSGSSGYSNRSGALGWVDNVAATTDVLYWTESLISACQIFYGTSACFNGNICGLGLAAGSSGIRSSGNLIFPGNLTTYCIWNEGYGGGIQLKRSDATTDRYARIGIVNDTGVWVSGMSIDGATAFGKFDAGICTAGGACLAKVFVNSATDDAASALQVKVLAANATAARIASTTNNNLFSFISNGTQGHAIMDMGRCTESGTFGAGYIRLRVDGNSWIQGGCVGINTGSPDQSLTVNQGATTTGQGIPATSSTTQNGILRLRPAVGVYGETLDFGMNVTPTYGWIQSTNASDLSTNYALRLNPNGGSVTVGTSCAAFGRKLTVQSDVVAYYSDTENITMGISAGTGAQSWGIQVCDTGDGNSTLHLNARGGYVGINKGSGNAAAYSLDVTGIIKASSSIISDSNVTACAFQGVGFSTLTAGSGTGTAVFDTITRSGAGLYEVALIANGNAGGASYNDFYYGRLLIGTGYQYPNVVDYLVWCQESTQPRTLYGSGAGDLTVRVCMYQSSVESSCIGTNGSYTIRFKISGYNSSYTGAGTTIYIKRII
jgi:hypothetical protein